MWDWANPHEAKYAAGNGLDDYVDDIECHSEVDADWELAVITEALPTEIPPVK